MKIQSLAVIAIIIILPLAIILSSYSDSQIKTVNLQITYDAKLRNSTYDAIKAFQLNMSNSSTSNVADSKMRDIKASINTFYNSLSNNFNMPGYGANVLQNYVPAIVYTLYDGYYIYSAYDNNLDVKNGTNPDGDTFSPNATYKNGEKIYGLKPYIYYSCRYKKNNSDFVITYSLDSYITVQGIVNGVNVNKSGYLLTGVSRKANSSGEIKYEYDGIEISEEKDKEGLRQLIYIPGGKPSNSIDKLITFGSDWNSPGCLKWYPYKKINGVKYYKDGRSAFVSINDEIIVQSDVNASTLTTNRNAIKYYEDAYEFSDWVKRNLADLTTYDAVDQNGNYFKDYPTIYPEDKNPPFQIYREIFKELNNTSSGKWIEEPNSEFNAHKTEVIKNAIESNLIVAISNYNNVSTSDVNFSMPKLQDYEWEELTKNISMITFLQGLSIGGKVYNGYSIVRNDLTEDYVSEDSIYITYHGDYYRVTDSILVEDDTNLPDAIGLLNTDFERRTSLATATKKDGSGEKLTKNIYYYPRQEYGSYSSIINLNNIDNRTILQYLKDGKKGSNRAKFEKLAQIYYTALGRERYGMYRVNSDPKEIQDELRGVGY